MRRARIWVLVGCGLCGCRPGEGVGARSVGAPTAGSSALGVQRVVFVAGARSLELEFLDDDLLHFRVSAVGAAPAESEPIATTPQVAKTDYTGPQRFTRGTDTFETAELRARVDAASLCVTLTDTLRHFELTQICPFDLGTPEQRLSIARAGTENVYGLGEQFWPGGSTDGDWLGRVRSSPDPFGNQMVPYDDGRITDSGKNGNAQFPVLYALGAGSANYALFIDHIRAQTWDLRGDPWRVQTSGGAIAGYVLTGSDLPQLRQSYLELVGRPPVPPKKFFGLWVSEYGYDDWEEVDGKLATLRERGFPVDGFVLDLQWFGGITAGSEASNMGRVSWDLSHFPDPSSKLAKYAAQGIGLLTIEESYVSRGLPEHASLAQKGYLVRTCEGCAPVYLTENPWWGKGGMIDWTSEAAGDYWHDQKRQPLIEAGVLGHWIDLGEPEAYAADDWVTGVLPRQHSHADYHNLYNFAWARSIARGYARNGVTRRPFILARSGASGIQRFGVALWSGDIASRFGSLRAQLNAEGQLSLSGIDYFGSDVGGFYRNKLEGNLDDLYTRWFADSLWLDVPVRPHTFNIDPQHPEETAPDRVGDRASNLANLRQRYAFIPYLYSLAHRAYRVGEPFAPPLVYQYQSDPNVRELGSEKLIGKDLLVACVTEPGPPAAEPGATVRDVYLPAGDWVDDRTGQWFHSAGQSYTAQPLFVNGLLRVPVYVRAGALLPKQYVDAQTLNALGLRADGTEHTELILRVVAAPAETHFTLYEDDGTTIAYRAGAVRETLLSQSSAGAVSTVTIGAASGGYEGAPSERDRVVELITEGRQATAVSLNGSALEQQPTRAAFDAAPSGWFNGDHGLVLARSGLRSVHEPASFAFTTAVPPAHVPN
jgi:alpha-glucosidase (family GH31 glycosyl hydrolase)